tara:strand:+ start:550 stop:1140 length:591 start_codon:yes stop_codon:yes gene_type:complete
MKEYELDKITLIGGWFIPKKICSDLIKFIDSQPLVDGMMYSDKGNQEIIKDLKESKEAAVDFQNEDEPFHTYKIHLANVLDKYIKKYSYVDKNTPFALREKYNLQKYPVGGGFKIWHYENDFNSNINWHRGLVFMTYLNDVEDGGTEFLYQNLKVPAIKGLTLIWPAFFTHTHKGQISKTKEKYIVTGWYNHINLL